MKTKRKKDIQLFYVILFCVLALYALFFVVMFAWGFISSFKDQMEFMYNAVGLPDVWHFKNYSFVLFNFVGEVTTSEGVTRVGFLQMYGNSFLYCTGCAFLCTFVPCVVAYLAAKYNFAFSKVLYGIVIITMSLPLVNSTAASLKLAKNLGLYNHIWGMWLMSANFLGGVYFLLFFETFKALPMSYKEAAEIDGASQLGILFRIMLPIVANTFFTIFLLNFVARWNDYQTPLLFLPKMPTISYGLWYFSFMTVNELTPPPMKLTAAFLVCIPILILFTIFSKRLMSNLTAGGIKG